MRMSGSVDGLTETNAALQAIPPGVRTVVAGYVEEWADLTLSGTLLKVPRGATGALAQSYGKNIRADGLQAAVGSSLHRSRFAELGTRRQRAKPHLYPAFRAANRVFRARIKNTVADLGKIRTRVRRYRKPVRR